jgi:hypothetical protein
MIIGTTQPRSRRALLGGGLAALAATIAGALGRPPAAEAGQRAVRLGEHNSASTTTSIRNATNLEPVFRGSSLTGDAIRGRSSQGIGVSGRSTRNAGVFGMGSPGVYGWSPASTGVSAGSITGFALETQGRLNLDTSGVATIPAGATSVTVSPPVEVTFDSFVLLTPRANIGARALLFTTDKGSGTFTIRMSSARQGRTEVSWLLLR